MNSLQSQLIALYRSWMVQQGLSLGSADEHLHDPTLTDAQRDWLACYVELWDATK